MSGRPPAPPSYAKYRRRQAARPYRARRKATYTARRPAARKVVRAPHHQPSLGRKVLEAGGTLAGSLVGYPALGKSAGSMLSDIVGLGDYQIKKNIFLQGRLPVMNNPPAGGGTIIRHTEYLGDVITSPVAGAFLSQQYLINAANNDTFPWLSQIAANYEQYSFEGIVFQFRSTSADALNSTNTALGSVMMATQYDVADTPFVSKTEMLNYEFSNSIKPSDNCLHMIECAPRQSTLTELYTLPGAPPDNYDPRFYNLGRFQIATVGFQGTGVNVGELHVTYQVRLLKPKLYDALGFDVSYASISLIGVQGGNLFGTSQTPIDQSNLDITFIGTNSFQIPKSAATKRYYISYFSYSTSAAQTPTVGAFTITNGRIPLPSSFTQNPLINTQSFAWALVIEADAGKACTVASSLTATQTLNGYLRVVEIPQDAAL